MFIKEVTLVKASYVIARELAVSLKPFLEEDILKKCMLMNAEVICPDKRQAFANISLSRKVVAESVIY